MAHSLIFSLISFILTAFYRISPNRFSCVLGLWYP